MIPASNERRNDGRAVTLADTRELSPWPTEPDWCSVKVRRRVKIDERVPASVMVDEERILQGTRLGEKSVLCRRVNKVPVGIASTRLGQPKNVIRTLLASRQKDDSKEWSRASFALPLPPRDERALVCLVVEQFRADALFGIRVDGLGGLVDLEVDIELFAGESELEETVGIERVRNNVDASFAFTIKERDGTSVAVSGDERMHDNFGDDLRVLKP